MKIRSLNIATLMSLSLIAVPGALTAQNSATEAGSRFESSSLDYSTIAYSGLDGSEPLGGSGAEGSGSGSTRGIGTAQPVILHSTRPFTRFSIGGQMSVLGAGAELSTNLFPHLNFRTSGNYFTYGVSGYKAQGFDVAGNLHMQSTRASIDYYPFHLGFRLSPGVMLFNQNRAIANVGVPSGAAFQVDNQTYYSETGSNAVHGTGLIRFGSSKPVFTATTGWGNTIPRAGHHLSFPVEIGAAFQQAPTINFGLSGVACYDSTHYYCTDIADKTNPIALQIQQGVQTQITKYQNELERLKTFPIVSFGVAYSFGSGRMSQVR